MKNLRNLFLFLTLLLVLPSVSFAQGGGDEWDKLNKESLELIRAGQYDAAAAAALKAVAIAQKALGQNHIDVAKSLNNLALAYYNKGEYSKAEPLLKRSLAISQEALGKHPLVVSILGNLAEVYRAQGDYASAEPLLKLSLEIREEKLGPEHPDVALSLNNLAGLLESKKDYAKAAQLFKRSLAIGEKTLGPNHPDVAISLNNLAGIYETQGDYTKAESLYKRSLAIKETVFGPNHPNVAKGLNNLAFIYYSQGNYAKAEPLYKRSLAIQEKALGLNHPDVATSIENLAALYRATKRHDEAERLEQRNRSVALEVLPTPGAAKLTKQAASATQGKIDKIEIQQVRLVEQIKAELTGLPDSPRREKLTQLLAEIEQRMLETPKSKFYLKPSMTMTKEMSDYYERMMLKIEDCGTHNFPQTAEKNIYGKGFVLITLDVGGNVLDADVAVSSGKKAVDAHMIKVVRASSSFGALPVKVTTDNTQPFSSIVITAKFDFKKNAVTTHELYEKDRCKWR